MKVKNLKHLRLRGGMSGRERALPAMFSGGEDHEDLRYIGVLKKKINVTEEM